MKMGGFTAAQAALKKLRCRKCGNKWFTAAQAALKIDLNVPDHLFEVHRRTGGSKESIRKMSTGIPVHRRTGGSED